MTSITTSRLLAPVVALLCYPGVAFAQSEVLAKTLFDEGVALEEEGGRIMTEGLPASETPPASIDHCFKRRPNDERCPRAATKFLQACVKIREASELKPNAERLFSLATCWDFVNRLASAQAAYESALLVVSDKDAKYAKERLKDLSSRVPQLILHVPDDGQRPPDMKIVVARAGVERDVTNVVPSLWNKSFPIDGGNYTIQVSAGGYKSWSKPIDIDNDATGRSAWEVTVPPLVPSAPPSATSSTSSAPTGTSSGGVPEPPSRTWQSAIGWTSFVVGVAGTAAGAIAGGLAYSQWSSADGACPDHKNCSPSARKLGSEAGTAADVSTAGFIVGGVGAAGALLFLVILPRASRESTSVTAVPVAGPGHLGATVTGHF